MLRGTYVGKDTFLKGEKALLKVSLHSPDILLAQFDDLELVRDGIEYSLGWHVFSIKDFVLDEEIKDDEHE